MSFSTSLMLFLEGMLAFISPCILPMLPVYIMYLAGESTSDSKDGNSRKRKKLIINTLGFISGFTIIFVALGATATALGSILNDYRLLLQRISGLIIIIFGLNFMGVLKIGFLNKARQLDSNVKGNGYFPSLIFGMVFSFGWTPCLGTFLGAALLMAGGSGTVLTGMIMLFIFSMGLGLPFLITALIFDSLKSTFDFIKKNYNVINIVSGSILIIIGLLMITNLFGFYAGLFS